MGVRDFVATVREKIASLKADLAAERAAREKAERERDAASARLKQIAALDKEYHALLEKAQGFDAAQAKLAKAVESLRWARQRIRPSIDGPRDFAFEDEIKRLDALLAEIGGGT